VREGKDNDANEVKRSSTLHEKTGEDKILRKLTATERTKTAFFETT
jgi:hypothetical protein